MVSDGTAAENFDTDGEEDEDKIDWFELRPEVKCGGFTLSESQWEAILTTGVFQLSPDHAPTVVGAESVEKLRQLRESVVQLRERPKESKRRPSADCRDDIR